MKTAFTFAALLAATVWLAGAAAAEEAMAERNPSKSGAPHPTEAAAGEAEEPTPESTDPRRVEAALASEHGTSGLQVVRKEPYGAYLADAEGRAVYLFTKDRGTPSCTGPCASAWPPVTTEGEAQALGEGVRERLLQTTRHPAGRTQLTYAGHPLYYFVRDAGPGEARGQDVEGFGGEWYLVSPTGEKVDAEDEPSASP